jgi:hypothetical protein
MTSIREIVSRGASMGAAGAREAQVTEPRREGATGGYSKSLPSSGLNAA